MNRGGGVGDQERGRKWDKKYKNWDGRNSESWGIGEGGGKIQEVEGCYPLDLPAAFPTPSPSSKVILVPFEQRAVGIGLQSLVHTQPEPAKLFSPMFISFASAQI